MKVDLRTVKFQMMLTEAEVKAIDDYRFANRIISRAEAIRVLVKISLDQAGVAL
jgi:hypothetical protein